MTKNFDTEATKDVVTSISQATTSTQPFMGTGSDNKPVIVGDVNNLDSEADYVVEFLYPAGYAISGDYEETPHGRKVVRKFTGATISPKKGRRMRHAVSVMLLHFSKVDNKTGEHEIMTIADVAEIYGVLSNEVVEAMETILQVTLGISDMDMEYVTDSSLSNVVGEIIQNNSGFFQRDTN